MSNIKYVDLDGLSHFKAKTDNEYVAKETGKGLSTNDYTTAEKTKLAGLSNYDDTQIQSEIAGKVDKVTGKGLSTNDLTDALKQTYDDTVTTVAGLVAEGGEPNVIETVKVNGTALTPDANKAVNVTVPTKVSDLTNDGDGTTGSKFATESYVTTNGGKIDKIKVNNVEQTITNKTVNITVPTKTSDLTNDDNVVKDASYVHTDNNFTTTLKNKLDGISAGAEVNAINTIKINGTSQTITSKAVDITVPTNNNQLTNGAGYQTASDVSTAISTAISSTYKAKGSVAFANLPALSSANEGNVYNVTDSFTTTSSFVEGAGKTYPANTNVVIINTTGTTYKYDVLSGFVDLSGYVLASELIPYTNSEIDTIFA